MTTQAEPDPTAELPAFPQERSAQCPFDPPAAYRDWRQTAGLRKARLWDGSQVWMVTRYEDIRTALRDPRVSADARHPGFPRVSPGTRVPGPEDEVVFARTDDPRHAEHRRMLTRFFTVKRAESMRQDIENVVSDNLDRMTAHGRSADLVTEFALPVPSEVIARLLDVPYEDHAFFQENSRRLFDFTASAAEVRGASEALTAYLLRHLERKLRQPGDDLLSRLVTERIATGQLTRQQAAPMAMALLVAGHETTATMIALGTLALLRHPDQLALVRDTDDARVVAGAVEEILRHLTIADNVVVRVAREDLTLAGQPVRAGEGLVLSLPSGNRDEAFRGTDPDALDVRRPATGHLAFGYGPHQCLGQNLARVELRIALPALLRRLPGLRLAIPFEDVAFRRNTALYGLNELPVTW
ncbi:cytochrome P450 [Streptomyces sp. BBFR51]|uniref:cytochrome P450 n=1 Tax=Streptomyces sp. BBFR51 TaxID=3372856 RepID=UPI0037DCA08A